MPKNLTYIQVINKNMITDSKQYLQKKKIYHKINS